MNKAALLQLEHFNKSNALSWALTMGLFAMPVIYSDREWNQIIGESYYIQLGPQDSLDGRNRRARFTRSRRTTWCKLKDEIYRVCYLMHAGGRDFGQLTQSALEQAVGLQRHAGSAAGLRRYGEGLDEAGAVAPSRRRGRTAFRSTYRGWTSSISTTSAASWTTPRSCWRWGSSRRR